MPALPPITRDLPTLPVRAATAHKGQVGRIAIMAGSTGMSGAAVLAGLGALRGGAGLVRVLCPESVQPIVAASEPCLMTVPITEDEAGLAGMNGKLAEQMYDWCSAAAIGPGLGRGALPRNNVREVLMHCTAPLVVDADALNILASSVDWAASGPAAWRELREKGDRVITPHPGEMARLRSAAHMQELRGDDDQTRLRIAHEYACYSQCVVVLKGHRTVVCAQDCAFVNTTGNPGMATGGMGDVLSGLIAALLGQGLGAFDAARLGVYVHGLAGDLCAEHIGAVGLLARDVAQAIPQALAQMSSHSS